jgi:antitoxin YefM
MTTVTAAEFRKSMAKYLTMAEEDCVEVVVTRPKGKKSVIISWDEYESLKETAYLMSEPANRKHLLSSLAELKAGKGTAVAIDTL